MNRSRLAVGCMCALALVSAGLAHAELGPAVPKDKKLIAWGCDQVDAAEVRQRVTEMEQMPFDGVVMTIHPDALRKTVGKPPAPGTPGAPAPHTVKSDFLSVSVTAPPESHTHVHKRRKGLADWRLGGLACRQRRLAGRAGA